MNKTIRLYTITALAVTIVVTVALMTGCGSSEASYEYDNFADAKEASQGEPILIDFYTDWCKYCKMMDTTTFEDSAVVSYIKDNILVAKVNAEVDSTLAQSYGVTGYPTLVLVEPDGTEIDRFIGFYPPERFLPTLANYVQGEGTFAELEKQAQVAMDPITNIQLAGKYQERGEIDKALSLLNETLEMNLSDSLTAEVMLRKADANVLRQNYNRALEIFEETSTNYPNTIGGEQAGFFKGVLNERIGDTTAAVTAYEEFVTDFPNSPAVPQVKMRIQQLQGVMPQN